MRVQFVSRAFTCVKCYEVPLGGPTVTAMCSFSESIISIQICLQCAYHMPILMTSKTLNSVTTSADRIAMHLHE